MTLTNNVFTTHSPLDNMRFVSLFGNLYAGAGCTGSAGPQDIVLTCDPVTNTVTIPAADCNLCQTCQPKPNSFSGGVESNAFFFAEQFVDLSGACINIAEDITITADARSPIPPYLVLTPPAGPPFQSLYAVNIEKAEIRNDFQKPGYIAILAQPPLQQNGKPLWWDNVHFFPGDNPSPFDIGFGVIWYDNAVLVDDGANGGGIDPQAVSFMNGYRASQPGNCGPVTLNCIQRAIPPRGWIASPRGPLVQGIARCDS